MMCDLPSTCCLVHYATYDPPNQSVGIRVNLMISTNHVGTEGLAFREISVEWLLCAHSRCSPLKGGNSHWDPSSYCNTHFGITYKYGPIKT